MHPQIVERHVEGSTPKASGSYGVSLRGLANVLRILRDRLYTDKPLAVIREYATNAYDAHIEAGIPDRPIRVTLPTKLNPALIIRDYGPGLSEDRIFGHFTQYGDSSKWDDQNQVGHYGIGCKVGHAYSDTFTVTSWHDGKRKVYVSVLDETDIGRMDLLSSVDDDGPTGLEVSIPVEEADIYEFKETAQRALSWFRPAPELIGGTIEESFPRLGTTLIMENADGAMGHGHGEWIAHMGPLAYSIDVRKLFDEDGENFYVKMLHKYHGVFHFALGEITVTANREEVEYSKITKAAVERRATAMFEAMIADALDSIRRAPPGITRWLEYKRIVTAYGVKMPGLPELEKELGIDTGTLKNWMIDWPWHNKPELTPTTFRLVEYDDWSDKTNESWRVGIDETEHFIVMDQPHAVALYKYTENNGPAMHRSGNVRQGRGTFVKLIDGATAEQAIADLEKVLADMGMQGIRIMRLSNSRERTYDPAKGGWVVVDGDANAPFEYERPIVKPKRKSLSIYRKVTFRLIYDKLVGHKDKHSDAWEAVDIDTIPQGGVFVLLEAFRPMDMNGRYEFERKLKLLQDNGIARPTIYGFKHTDTKPMIVADLEQAGYVHFTKWLASSVEDAIKNGDLGRKLDLAHFPYDWRAMENLGHINHHGINGVVSPIEALVDVARDYKAKNIRANIHNLNSLAQLIGWKGHTDWDATLKGIRDMYPLFELAEVDITKDNAAHWSRYFHLIETYGQ